MESDQAPHVRVILSYADKNQDPEKLGAVWYPGDNLHGHLELSNARHLTIERITIYFEGVSRIWIAEGPVPNRRILTGERKFLSQAHDILLSDMMQDGPDPGHVVLEAPFHFVISRLVASPESGSPEQCLQLPPSLELGDLFIDRLTGKRFAQPRIAYNIRASVKLNMRSDGSAVSLETSLPVVIVPLTEELPPTETSDFPFEFKESDTKVLRRFPLGSTLGPLKFSMQEPPPLVIGSRSDSSSTMAVMKLEFESTSLVDAQKSLQGLSFTVCPLLRAKTFYSVNSFPMLPSQSLLDSGNEVRLHDSFLKLGTWYVSDARWGTGTICRIRPLLVPQIFLAKEIILVEHR
ncbi:hypothetical protein OIDMADRAFT_33837 [Oidiodendron maius Zn]|uniref:Arrestin-like N-terminal domain-containing protein n=1 Tax=Oidiodendron maius (strain Zn) TaxID=913774 RepID=A0A0C3GWY6_OIDMZ|nr:hypothetical protein OIDMADRAFT_33837 [Oidiodendron maius Zn]